MELFFILIIILSVIIIIKWSKYEKKTNELLEQQKKKYTHYNRYAIFETNVVGVTFKNADNTNRQKLIKQLQIDDILILEPYIYKNEDAIYVKNTNGQILGNIPKIAVKATKKRLDNNLILKTTVSTINSFINENNEEIYYLKINIFLNANNLSKL